MTPPKVRFLTKIYHPNIDKLGRICLDVLKSQLPKSRSEHIGTDEIQAIGHPLCRSEQYCFQYKPCLEHQIQTIRWQTMLHRDGKKMSRQLFKQRGNGRELMQ